MEAFLVRAQPASPFQHLVLVAAEVLSSRAQQRAYPVKTTEAGTCLHRVVFANNAYQSSMKVLIFALAVRWVSTAGNDSDADGSDTISISSMSAASNGSIVNNGDGTYTYTSSAIFMDSNQSIISSKTITGANCWNRIGVPVETYEYTGRGGDSWLAKHQ